MFVTLSAQNVETYENIVKELSSAKYYGRNDYRNGEKLAAEYIMRQFSKICTPDFVEQPKIQEFSYPLNVMRGKLEFAVDGIQYEPSKDFVVKEFSPTSDREMPIIYALNPEYYTPDDFCRCINSLGAENSFVVIDYDLFHKNLDRPGQEIYLTYLMKLNVGGVIFKYSRRPEFFKARSGYNTPFPVVCVGLNFPDNAKRASVTIDSKMLPKHISNNIYAWVKGTSDSDEYYVLIAHYDHNGFMGKDNMFPGANDNASGSAALLTLAEHFSKLENRPEHSILFLWVGGEESNLLGSKYYVNNPIYPLDKIKQLINLDMIGDTGEELVCESGENGQSALDQMKEMVKKYDYFPKITQEELSDNSDHYYFAIKGVPAMYFETKGQYYQYYHTPWDTFENFTSESYVKLFNLVTEFISSNMGGK